MIALIERFTWLDWALIAGVIIALLAMGLDVLIFRPRRDRKFNSRKWRPRGRSAWIDDP